MSSVSAITESIKVPQAIDGRNASRFLHYIHSLRGVAILFVVGVHARGSEADWSSPVMSNFIQTFFDNYEGNGTIMFMFIAGFLFQHLTYRQFNYKSYLNQKFKFIILPYILISVPIILVRMEMNFTIPSTPQNFHEQSWPYQFFYYLFTGAHLAPFWFIATIILVYISSSALHALDNRIFYRYIFPVILVAGLFTYRPEHNNSPMLAYLHYLPVYITGMWASFNKDKLLAMGNPFLFVLIGAYLLISLMDMAGVLTEMKKLDFEYVIAERMIVLNLYFLRGMILCFAGLLIVYKIADKKLPFLELLSEYSFGIFFLHFIFIIITRKIITVYYGDIQFSLITFIIYYLFILMISVVSVYIIKRFTGRFSRFIIGS